MWASEVKEKLKPFNLPSDVVEKIVDAVLQGQAEFLINPDEVIVANGSQKWGSGGYRAYYDVWLGEIEIVDSRDKSSQFISATEYKIKPKTRPTVVRCVEYDCISRSGIRYFKNFVVVWA